MSDVAQRHAPGLLIVGALSGAALGYLISQLAAHHEAIALTVGCATLGTFLAVLLDMLCSRYQVADVLPHGAKFGCLGVGAATLVLVTGPSIAVVWLSGMNYNLMHFALAAETHVILLLVACLSGAIGGAMAAAFAAASAAERTAGRRETARSLVLSLSGYILGLLLCVVVRSVEFGMGVGAANATTWSALLYEWAVLLDHHTLATLSVGGLAASACWIIAGPSWQWWPGNRRRAEVKRITASRPTEAANSPSNDGLPPGDERRELKAAILARMSARSEESRGNSPP